jgi:hypothetical protein
MLLLVPVIFTKREAVYGPQRLTSITNLVLPVNLDTIGLSPSFLTSGKGRSEYCSVPIEWKPMFDGDGQQFDVKLIVPDLSKANRCIHCLHLSNYVKIIHSSMYVGNLAKYSLIWPVWRARGQLDEGQVSANDHANTIHRADRGYSS